MTCSCLICNILWYKYIHNFTFDIYIKCFISTCIHVKFYSMKASRNFVLPLVIKLMFIWLFCHDNITLINHSLNWSAQEHVHVYGSLLLYNLRWACLNSVCSPTLWKLAKIFKVYNPIAWNSVIIKINFNSQNKTMLCMLLHA